MCVCGGGMLCGVGGVMCVVDRRHVYAYLYAWVGGCMCVCRYLCLGVCIYMC